LLPAPPDPRRRWPVAVSLGLWVVLAGLALGAGASLQVLWPGWRFGFGALAMWGGILLVLFLGVKGPLCLSRTPVLTVLFAGLMTLLGTGSYWATIQLYPLYRVNIERAAFFVATCTLVAMVFLVPASRWPGVKRGRIEWDYPRLRLLTLLLLGLSLVGTLVTLQRIGYLPLISGDPNNARVEFPSIGGVWYRLSLLGGVVAMLVAVQACAREANWGMYLACALGLAAVSVYGPRFPVALPLGVGALMWDRLRKPLKLRWAVLALAILVPVAAFLGYWRERMVSASLLRPTAQLVYGAFVEFRELAWTLEYYRLGDRFLHGSTLPSVIVPLAPSPLWAAVGVDKATVYAHTTASVLADQMGADSWQRVGLYGECFVNFGWPGALLAAAVYGILLGWLDKRFRLVGAKSVAGVVLALAIAASVFAQVGELDMFTSTGSGCT